MGEDQVRVKKQTKRLKNELPRRKRTEYQPQKQKQDTPQAAGELTQKRLKK